MLNQLLSTIPRPGAVVGALVDLFPPARTDVALHYTPVLAALDDPLYFGGIAGFFVLQVAAYFALVRAFPTSFATPKQRGWILTAIDSLVFTVASVPFCLSFMLYRGPIGLSPMMTWDTVATLTSAFFVAYLLADLIVGTLLYRSEMSPTSGYFHHTLYIFMVFNLKQWGLLAPFCVMGILEAPTMLLAIAQIDKRLRNDRLFGAVFFVTRLVFHVYFTFHLLLVGYPRTWVFVYPCAVLPLHVMWFRGWIRQQLRLRAAKLSPSHPAKTPVSRLSSSVSRPGSPSSSSSSPESKAAAARAQSFRPDRRRASTWRHAPPTSPAFSHGHAASSSKASNFAF